jgi:two-component system nitrogen regulation sensor histidine kinase NtrY
MLLRPTPVDPAPPPAPEVRRRPLDNPRVLIAAALVLIALLIGLSWLSDRTTEIALPVLTDVVLYALLAVDVALLLTLCFVLARSLLKLWVEQRQAAPFARFRAKLVAALLAMSIIPAVLVLISGSSIITNSTALWFNDPVTEVLGGAQTIATRWYQDHQETIVLRAEDLARRLPAADVAAGGDTTLEPILRTELATLRDGMIEIYRAVAEPGRPTDVTLVTAVESPTLPRDTVRASTASADRIASRVVTTGAETATEDQLESGGVLVRSAWPVRDADRTVVGAVVVSRHLPAAIRGEAQKATAAFQRYQSLFVLRAPLQFFFLSIFVTVTLLILISATWLGLYLAKRITRPVQQLAEGARAIGAGRLDFRLEPESGDELGSLVEAFNMMAAELSTSREKLEESTRDLAFKNIEVDARRRYIETILERVATGVISLDAHGRITTVNGAAMRLLGLDASSRGRPAREVFSREELQPLLPLVHAIDQRDQRGLVQEITLALADREIHLAGAATILTGGDRRAEGAVLVLDDVTPLIRAQRVAAWRDVARRLAHEIKNPLTPIQLSAERLRRHFSGAPPQTTALVGECTDAIIAEVEALKGLVDEFAQFARLRGPRMVPTSLNRLVDETLNLYGAVLQRSHVRLERRLEPELPLVRLDAEQIRQVIINLVDNAIEALGGTSTAAPSNGEPPTIVVTTTCDERNGIVRLVVTDNGPGVPAADREKLFMPYYSTKGRGSGLGLAIVRRIVVEHGGGIEAAEARPSGTTFTVELPAA